MRCRRVALGAMLAARFVRAEAVAVIRWAVTVLGVARLARHCTRRRTRRSDRRRAVITHAYIVCHALIYHVDVLFYKVVKVVVGLYVLADVMEPTYGHWNRTRAR